jgi:hypothetical protein
MAEAKNLLYYGDNLDVLRQHVKDETIATCCRKHKSSIGFCAAWQA